MLTALITAVPVPGAPADGAPADGALGTALGGPAPAVVPEAALEGWHEVETETNLATLGHDDFVDPTATLVASYAHQAYASKVLLVASEREVTAAADVLGGCWLVLPRTDNTHLAHGDLVVRPGARGRGVGTALWRAVEDLVRGAGRTTVTTWTSHTTEPPADAPDALTAPTGVGRLSTADPAVRFALAHSFVLEQTERQSTLDLPVPAAALVRWRAGAQAAAGPDYRVVQWQDRTPDRWLDAVADLQQHMSVDAPSAGVDFQQEVWDAARVRDRDEQTARVGRRYVLTAAEHVPTGELVAFTQMVLPQARPEVAYQEDTLVRADHRGHRLGLLVKAANLQLLAEVQPAARRVHTWNAGENAHMLAINTELGFRPASIEGAWQRRLV
ncbi:GNAT family N-acetyltransferase [Georgenia sp. TF02-10]|uniref:GNAT family N-acetyltransferase n=1 Tax=Georgenia sp. TF02-10 TaxID=2917725 RepID=UPI001FA7A5A8|nr:GNAT family N-acetyltransferase [Georgenia sp. TF02-10]UNX55052.1 GNAT family N-acetyltransferase [Georgenia sp. TF02-10]